METDRFYLQYKDQTYAVRYARKPKDFFTKIEANRV